MSRRVGMSGCPMYIYVLVLYDSTIHFYAGFLASQLEITVKWLSQGTRDSGWRSDCQAAAGFVFVNWSTAVSSFKMWHVDPVAASSSPEHLRTLATVCNYFILFPPCRAIAASCDLICQAGIYVQFKSMQEFIIYYYSVSMYPIYIYIYYITLLYTYIVYAA